MASTAWRDGLERSGALHPMSSHGQLQLPQTRNAVDVLGVDTDDKSAGCDVLIAKPCPLIRGWLVELRDLTGKEIAGVRLDDGGADVGRLGAEIDASNERPTLDLKSLIMPGDVFDASGQRGLALA